MCLLHRVWLTVSPTLNEPGGVLAVAARTLRYTPAETGGRKCLPKWQKSYVNRSAVLVNRGPDPVVLSCFFAPLTFEDNSAYTIETHRHRP
jgi:hypothetical protein